MQPEFAQCGKFAEESGGILEFGHSQVQGLEVLETGDPGGHGAQGVGAQVEHAQTPKRPQRIGHLAQPREAQVELLEGGEMRDQLEDFAFLAVGVVADQVVEAGLLGAEVHRHAVSVPQAVVEIPAHALAEPTQGVRVRHRSSTQRSTAWHQRSSSLRSSLGMASRQAASSASWAPRSSRQARRIRAQPGSKYP